MTGGLRLALEASGVKLLLSLLISLLLGMPVVCELNLQKRITRSYVGADLRTILQDLATVAEAEIYIGPAVQGTVSMILPNITVEGALTRILSAQGGRDEFRLLHVGIQPDRYVLVVGPSDKLDSLDPPSRFFPERWKDGRVFRMEYLLDNASPQDALDIMERLYPDVEFRLHPVENGFFGRGLRADLFRVRRHLRYLEREKRELRLFWMMPPKKRRG